jgi:hypothetical protein
VNPADLGPDLERLPGVLAATVFEDAALGPRIYLATGVQADREALHSTILALLHDRGLPADPDRIHIAVVPASAATPLPTFALDSMDVHRVDGRAEVEVRLRAGRRLVVGNAAEPDTSAGRARAAARAILGAVESLGPDLRTGLYGARRFELFGLDAVLVLVEATEGRAHVHLPGSALVEQSVEHAAAAATLAALRSWGP